MRLNVLVLAIALAGVTGSASAQRPATGFPVAPGSRVRVKATSLVAPLIVNFLEQRGDTLVFIEEGTGPGVWSFALSQVERLETTAGETARDRRSLTKGALIGGGSGLVTGFLFASIATPSDSSRRYSKPLTSLVGAAVGAGVGAIIGSRFKTERWVNVPLPRQLSLVPNRGSGFTLSVGIR